MQVSYSIRMRIIKKSLMCSAALQLNKNIIATLQVLTSLHVFEAGWSTVPMLRGPGALRHSERPFAKTKGLHALHSPGVPVQLIGSREDFIRRQLEPQFGGS